MLESKEIKIRTFLRALYNRTSIPIWSTLAYDIVG